MQAAALEIMLVAMLRVSTKYFKVSHTFALSFSLKLRARAFTQHWFVLFYTCQVKSVMGAALVIVRVLWKLVSNKLH